LRASRYFARLLPYILKPSIYSATGYTVNTVVKKRFRDVKRRSSLITDKIFTSIRVKVESIISSPDITSYISRIRAYNLLKQAEGAAAKYSIRRITSVKKCIDFI
jgi:hypothetical protein